MSFIIRIPRGTARIAWGDVSTSNAGTYGPTWVGYTTAKYDPVSQQGLHFAARSPNGIIYMTDIFSYKAATRVFTWLGGTGTVQNPPSSDGTDAVNYLGASLQPWPSDRHPIDQVAIDTFRGQMYLSRGVAGGVSPEDLWRYTLNSDPRSNTFESLSLPTVPTVEVTGSMCYVADYDLLVLHGTNSGGFPRTWVWACGSGGATAGQIAAGAATRGQWYNTYTTGTVTPAQSDFCNLISIPGAGKVLMFNHVNPTTSVAEYDLVAKTWTVLSPSGSPSEPATWSASECLVSYVTKGRLSGKVLYHQTAHAISSPTAATYTYDRSTNAWATLPSTGSAPDVLCNPYYDPTLGEHGGIVAWTYPGVMKHGVIY